MDLKLSGFGEKSLLKRQILFLLSGDQEVSNHAHPVMMFCLSTCLKAVKPASHVLKA
jgi:hypothetical protein